MDTDTLADGVDALFACDPAIMADPYPLYRRLREAAPVFLHGPHCVLTRYADIAAVLRDPRRFSSNRDSGSHRRAVLDALAEPERDRMRAMMRFTGLWMLTTDPPDHTRLRALANKAFTPRAIARLRGRIAQITDALLAPVVPRGEMDVIATLAFPLPITVIAESSGVPPEDGARIRRWSGAVAQFLDGFANLDAMEASVGAFRAYLRARVAERRARPGDDLLSGLVLAEETGGRLSEDELLAMCVLILLGGHETTTNLIANGLLALLRHPEQLARLRANPALIGPAVEECLRYDSPVQNLARVPTEDVEIGGVRIPAGTTMDVLIGAANRDPAQFPQPDRLDIARAPNAHLAVGHGVHYCIGAALGRMEAQIALAALIERLPNLRLATEAPSWRPNASFRGLNALPVTWSPPS